LLLLAWLYYAAMLGGRVVRAPVMLARYGAVPRLHVIVVVLLSFALPPGFAYYGMRKSAVVGDPRSFMIVESDPGAPVKGTILAWDTVGALRRDFYLEPGPYSAAERRQMLGDCPPSAFRRGLTGEPVGERSPPWWLIRIAREHAGPRMQPYSGQGVAFGWPFPVFYCVWDWNTMSLQGAIAPANSSSNRPLSGTALSTDVVAHKMLKTGLLANGLALALPTLLGLWVFNCVRAIDRRRRGCCWRCGYSRRSLQPGTPCPECGAVPPRPPA
jgi:hypothetical protein